MASMRYALLLAVVCLLLAACGDARPLQSGAGPSVSLPRLPTLGPLPSASTPAASTPAAVTPLPSASPTPSPTPSFAPSPSSPPSASPSPPPPPSPSPSPPASPSVPVEPSPSAGGSGGLPDFNDAQQTLLAHVPDPLRPHCTRYERHPFAFDVATIQCRASDAITLFYTVFGSAGDLDRGFDADAQLLQDRGGEECASGQFLGTYTSATGTEGRLMCREASGGGSTTTRIIEWSHPDLRILSYAVTTGASWDELYDAWVSAGPIDNEAGPAPSAQPSASIAPSATPEPSVVVEPSPSATFTSAEESIFEHVPEPLQPTCFSIGPFFDHEVDGLECKGSNGILVTYYLFSARTAMDTDYEEYLRNAGSPPATGKCRSGNSRGTYTIGGTPAGKYACMHIVDRTSKIDYAVIAWTDTRLNMLTTAFSATASWAQLIDFYENDAGPYR